VSMTLISTTTLGTATTFIEFSSITQSFTDLLLVGSLRSSAASNFSGISIRANDIGIGGRRLEGNGSSTYSQTFGTFAIPANTSTANTFNNFQCYLPNYSGSQSKIASLDATTENNASESYLNIVAGSFATTAALNVIRIGSDSGNFVVGSTISLYGILKGSGGASVS